MHTGGLFKNKVKQIVMGKIEFNKYSVVELSGLINVSDKNVKACFITDEKLS